MTLRIATFNLENLDQGPGVDPPIEDRIPILRPQIQRLDADLLCLQEVNAQRDAKEGPRTLAALDRLLEGTPYAAFHRAASTAEAGPADRHNLVVLSRWPIVERTVVRHDLVEPPRYRPATADPPETEPLPVPWDRPLLVVAIDLPDDRRLHLVNLHLRATLAAPVAGQKAGALVWNSVGGWAEGFFLATVKRSGQALEARLVVDRIFDREPEALIAVCGDFNAEEQEMPLRTILGDAEDTGNGRLAGRGLVAVDRGLPLSQRFSVRHGGQRVMLDHILASRALMAHHRHVEVHNEALGDELAGFAAVSHSPESYHAPLVGVFDLA